MNWRLAGQLGPDHGDPIFYVYLLKWVEHSLSLGFDGFWDPPFFHPMQGVLALSDHLLGPGLAFAGLRALGLSALAAYNLLYLGVFFVAGLTCWWMLRKSGLSWIAAVIVGWYFTFGHLRWTEQSHFNVLRIGWIPLVLWTFDRLLVRPSWRSGAAFALVYAIHLAGSTYFAYLVHLPLLILALNRRRELLELLRDRRRLAPVAAAAGFAALLLVVLFTGYHDRTELLRAERGLWEVRQYSPTLAALANAAPRSAMRDLVPALHGADDRGALYPGVLFVGGLAVATIAAWRRFRRPLVRKPGIASILFQACGALLIALGFAAADAYTLTGESTILGLDGHNYRAPLLSILAGVAILVFAQRALRGGPILRWSDMPRWPRGLLLVGLFALCASLPVFFWLLWETLPGMSGMRVTHRFFPFAVLALGYFAGRGFDLVLAVTRPRLARAVLAVALSTLAVAELWPHVRAWTPLADAPDFPAYQRYLAQDESVRSYLELPFYGDWRDLKTMYFGTEHWKPLVNGSSSFLPESRRILAEHCSRLSPTCLENLRRWRVSHLVLRREPVLQRTRWRRLARAERARVFDAAAARVDEQVASGELEPVFESDSAVVYRFTRKPEDASDGAP